MGMDLTLEVEKPERERERERVSGNFGYQPAAHVHPLFSDERAFYLDSACRLSRQPFDFHWISIRKKKTHQKDDRPN